MKKNDKKKKSRKSPPGSRNFSPRPGSPVHFSKPRNQISNSPISYASAVRSTSDLLRSNNATPTSITSQHMAPAYHSVPYPPMHIAHTSKPSTAIPSQDQSSSWPQALKDLVTSIFNRAGDRKDSVSQILKDYISQVRDKGEIWTIDWNNIVIPGLEEFTKKKRSFAESAAGFIDQSGSSQDLTLKKFQKLSTESWKSNFVQSSTNLSTISSTSNLNSFALKNNHIHTFSSSKISNNDYNTVANHTITKDEFREDSSDTAIIGTCTKIEKRYLRLTSAPDPATVRPEHILKEAMKMFRKKWKTDHDYGYLCDQLKAVRQDLTVQMIRNRFTVEVYEFHARIALEKHDLGEYNQCQAQLQQLYDAGIEGDVIEFMAYRLLYFVHTKNKTGISQFMKNLDSTQRKEAPIRHALDVRTAVAASNYHQLKYLYLNAPNMAARMMDNFMDRERAKALQIITRAYRPSINLMFVCQELGFMRMTEEITGEVGHERMKVDENGCLQYLGGLLSEDDLLKIFVVSSIDSDNPVEKDLDIDCKIALPLFIAAGKKYEKVDIKGQI